MARIHVCPLSQVEATVQSGGIESVVSLLALAHRVPHLAGIPDERRLHLALSDIVEVTENHVLAEGTHIELLLAFLRRWDRREPLLIHCYAGVSRSTAAAFIALCALDPERSEAEHAWVLRRASPTATPNRHIVALADRMLGRSGRMSSAVAAVGRGVNCFEGVSCTLDVPDLVEASARPAQMV